MYTLHPVVEEILIIHIVNLEIQCIDTHSKQL